MKASELKDKSQAELAALLDSSRKEYFRLKMRHVTGQLDRVSDLVRVRKDIARINTVIRERELRG
jgi:large subunit ribosomal protein L29